MLSELVANKPSHSQQEADCGGWAARRQQQHWDVENLKCGTMTFTGLWVNKPTSDGPRSFCMSHLKTPHGDLQQLSLHQCWWRAQPSPFLNSTRPALFQECRKEDKSERGLGDGLHMVSSWSEVIQKKISHGNHHRSSIFCKVLQKFVHTFDNRGSRINLQSKILMKRDDNLRILLIYCLFFFKCTWPLAKTGSL